jgi:hypothetical protein
VQRLQQLWCSTLLLDPSTPAQALLFLFDLLD